MKEIYNYLNYRQFLNDYYHFRKKERATFSLRFFGERVGIDASLLSKILKEERHLSPRTIDDLCSYIGFTSQEAHYFQILVLFNKAKKEEEQALYFEKLLALRPIKQTNIEKSQYQFYSQWYYTALRSILEFYPFYKGDSYSELGKQLAPAISAKEAKEGIELLYKLNLITLTNDNRYTLSAQAISTGDSWYSIAINTYQKKVIQLSADAIQHHPKKSRDISTITMNITKKEFKIIQEMIKTFRSSVIEYVNEAQEPTQTFQLNVQLFPVSIEPTED